MITIYTIKKYIKSMKLNSKMQKNPSQAKPIANISIQIISFRKIQT